MLKIKQIISFVVVLSAALISTVAVAAADFPCSSQKVNGIDGNPGYEAFFIFGKSSPQCEAARNSMMAAAVIVTGEKSSSKIYEWAKALAADPKYAEKFNEGLKFGDAVSWLKARIATNGVDRLFAIDNAFQEVYGRNSTPLEQATWDPQVKAQKAWYAPIVLAETAKLNDNPETRRTMIFLAYEWAFGRKPTEAEIQKWKAGKEHFRLLLDEHRRWLYTSDGAQERVDMLTNIYSAKYAYNKSKSKENWLKTALATIADEKMLYFEIVKNLQNKKYDF